MIPNKDSLPDRDFTFLHDRLRWLDQEITRYRDFEWKATSFHAAFFTALLYALLDAQTRLYLSNYKVWLTAAIFIYLVIACAQLIYIHRALNLRRNDRSDLLGRLGQAAPQRITRFFSLYEGLGAIFLIGFLLSLIFLATTTLLMLLAVSY